MTELKVNRELIKGDAVTERYEPSITINQLQTEKNWGYFNLGHIYLLLSLYSRWLFPDTADMVHFSNKAWEKHTCMTLSKQLGVEHLKFIEMQRSKHHIPSLLVQKCVSPDDDRRWSVFPKKSNFLPLSPFLLTWGCVFTGLTHTALIWSVNAVKMFQQWRLY